MMNSINLDFKNNIFIYIFFFIYFRFKINANNRLPPNIMDIITLTVSIIVAMTLSVFIIFRCTKRFLKETSSSNPKNEVNGNCAGGNSKKSSTASSTGSTNTSPNTVLSTQRTRSGRHVVHKKFSEDEILY